MTSPFEFYESLDNSSLKDSFVLRVPAGIQAKNDLLNAFASVGRFPTYFGRNWDALLDCLRDFEWIAEKQILITHIDMPLWANPDDCRTYLEILGEAVRDWTRTASQSAHMSRSAPFQNHTLRVFFPASMQGTIVDILAQ